MPVTLAEFDLLIIHDSMSASIFSIRRYPSPRSKKFDAPDIQTQGYYVYSVAYLAMALVLDYINPIGLNRDNELPNIEIIK